MPHSPEGRRRYLASEHGREVMRRKRERAWYRTKLDEGKYEAHLKYNREWYAKHGRRKAHE